MSDENGVSFLQENGRFVIQLECPPVNSLSPGCLREVAEMLERVRGNDDVRLVILRSALEGTFSRGFDYRVGSPEAVGAIHSAFAHLLTVLNSTEILTVAEVDGPCLGGALELAAFCDIQLASERSEFGHPEVHSGLYPPVGAALYPHLIGRNRTLDLLATGRLLPAREAVEMGLVSRVFSTASFRAQVQNVYADIERTSGLTLRLAKKAVERALYEKVMQAIDVAEDIYLNELLPSRDAREGLGALQEGRPPRWTHR